MKSEALRIPMAADDWNLDWNRPARNVGQNQIRTVIDYVASAAPHTLSRSEIEGPVVHDDGQSRYSFTLTWSFFVSQYVADVTYKKIVSVIVDPNDTIGDVLEAAINAVNYTISIVEAATKLDLGYVDSGDMFTLLSLENYYRPLPIMRSQGKIVNEMSMSTSVAR